MNPRGVAVVLVWALLLALGPGRADAFDDKREGFLLGFGAGLGSLHATEYSLGEGDSGLQTDLKIGRGLTEQWQLFYTGKQFWQFEDGGLLTGWLPAIGIAYYLRPTTRSLFLTGGLGVWMMGAGASGAFASLDVAGPGVFLGVGCELTRHVNLELDAGTCTQRDPGEEFTNVALTFSLVGY